MGRPSCKKKAMLFSRLRAEAHRVLLSVPVEFAQYWFHGLRPPHFSVYPPEPRGSPMRPHPNNVVARCRQHGPRRRVRMMIADTEGRSAGMSTARSRKPSGSIHMPKKGRIGTRPPRMRRQCQRKPPGTHPVRQQPGDRPPVRAGCRCQICGKHGGGVSSGSFIGVPCEDIIVGLQRSPDQPDSLPKLDEPPHHNPSTIRARVDIARLCLFNRNTIQ